MIDSQFLFFVVTSLIVIVAPGQDMVLVMSRSISLGTKAGVATASGVSVGLLGHTVLAALGLGAILQASETLFMALKFIGAAYLVYLGVRAFRTPPIDLNVSGGQESSLGRLFWQGALSNLSNPKIAVFYFAFLPQFVSAGTTNTSMQLLILGSVFALLTFLVKAPIGVIAGTMSQWLRSRPRVQIWLNRISGSVLIALGLRLALDDQSG